MTEKQLLTLALAAVSHEQCQNILEEVIRLGVAEPSRAVFNGHRGKIFIITTTRAVIPGFDETTYVCPHGKTFWIAPSLQLQRHIQGVTDRVAATSECPACGGNVAWTCLDSSCIGALHRKAVP